MKRFNELTIGEQVLAVKKVFKELKSGVNDGLIHFDKNPGEASLRYYAMEIASEYWYDDKNNVVKDLGL